MASSVDFPFNSEMSENYYISRLVDLPLYRLNKKPAMAEISCEPPKPDIMHLESILGKKQDLTKLKKSASCNSLSNHEDVTSSYESYESVASKEKPIYQTFHGTTTQIEPLRVQKPKKKKGFLRSLFKKKSGSIKDSKEFN